MRILHFIHCLPPELHGGTQGYVTAIANLQAADGHEVRIVTGSNVFDSSGFVEESRIGEVAVIRIRRDFQSEGLSGDLGSPRIGRLVEDIARAFAPDVAHVHHWHALTRDIAQRLRPIVPRIVVSLHDLFVSCPRHFRMPDHRSFCDEGVGLDQCARCVAPDVAGIAPSDLEVILAKRLENFRDELAAADVVLTMSAAQARLLGSIPAFRNLSTQVLPIGIAVEDRPPPRRHFDGTLHVTNWAGIDPRKGIHVLVAAVARAERREKIILHLHGRDGEPAYMQELRTLAKGIEMRLHGPYRDADRQAIAAAADVAVFPFLAFETYALVVDEALHLGLPVIVSNRGAPSERIGGRGLAVAPDDPSALAAELDRLVDEPERLEKMARSSHGARPIAVHHVGLKEVYAAPRS